MNDQLSMFDLMNCEDIPSATSSQELAAGPMPSDLQGGPMTDPSGQEAVPASHSAQQDARQEKQMNVTFGPSGTGSSASAALQQSLGNKLRQQLPTGGLTMFIKDWKRKVTPLGRQYCQLAVSARPISATDCGLWVSPTAQDHSRGNKPARPWDKGVPLSQQVVNCPTPNANKHTKNSADPRG